MKIAVTATGTTPESPLDARFGRAAYFLVFDPDTKTWETVENTQNLNAAQGAGIQTAERLAGLGVQAVMSGYVGPKAFSALRAAGLDVYQDMDNRSVGDAVRCLAEGSVTPATAPNK